MDSSQRPSPLRKTSYFEKYRRELERISEEMRTRNQASNSFSDKSRDSAHTHNPPNLLSSLHNPIPVQVAPPAPVKPSLKRSLVFEAQKEQAKTETREQLKTETREVPREAQEGQEEMREVQLLVGQLQAARGKLSRCEEQIVQKRGSYESLRRQVARAPPSSSLDLQNYAEKMLAIETRMKFKKELHEDELNRLLNERNHRHAENVELSKLIETLEEELQTLAREDQREQESANALQAQAGRLQAELGRLGREVAESEARINNSAELRELSSGEYRRYSEVYRRELVGREVAQAEERVRERNNEKRYLVEIERRKVLVRERRVESGVRQKALTELTRVIDFTGKEINALRKELANLTDKTNFFGK